MNKKLGNKGFTLVELLAVLVILIAIMSLAIPSITSSLERSKSSQDAQKQKIIESAAESYVTDYKNSLVSSSTSCYIAIDKLVEENYLSSDNIKDSDGNDITGYVIYNKTDGTFEYSASSTGNSCF